MKKIEIFYSPMCWACHEAMDYFSGRGLEYDSYEVAWKGEELQNSENARELQRRCGNVDFVPQIFIDGKHIGGWRKLSEMIESGEIEKVLNRVQDGDGKS